MKYKYQLFSYVVIFVVGYCSNFLLPLSFISFGKAKPELTKYEVEGKNKSSPPNHNYLGSIADNKKCTEPGIRGGEPKSDIVPLASAETKSPDKPEDLAALHNELAMLRDYRMQIEIAKHNEYLQARGGSSIEALNDNFKREPIDAAWAKDKENLINHLVNDSEHLSQMPHLAGECRSTQCKFSVLSDDQFYLNKLSASLDQVIAEHGASFASYSTIIDEKSHTTSIYFERK